MNNTGLTATSIPATQNHRTIMTTADMVSPLDALIAHFNASSKSVQRAFARIIIETRADELEAAREKAMVRQSLTQAFAELRSNQARPIEQLFAEL